jgi:hypothetical protein
MVFGFVYCFKNFVGGFGAFPNQERDAATFPPTGVNVAYCLT